jgi:hypothetical protein
VTIVETHEVGRLTARSADLDDLARPLGVAHNVAMYVEPVPGDCLHVPASWSVFAGGMPAPGAPGRQGALRARPGCYDQHPPQRRRMVAAHFPVSRLDGQIAVRRGGGHGASTFESGVDLGARHYIDRYARPQRNDRTLPKVSDGWVVSASVIGRSIRGGAVLPASSGCTIAPMASREMLALRPSGVVASPYEQLTCVTLPAASLIGVSDDRCTQA